MKATVKKPFTPGFMLYDWMAADLRLAMIPRLVFAMVFSFSVIDKDFYGSLNHVADRLGVSRRSVVEAFKELTAGGLLVKRTEVRNNVQYCVYNVAPEVLSKYTESPSEGSAEFAPGSAEIAPGSAEFAPGVVQKLHGGSAEIAPNNKKDITSNPIRIVGNSSARVNEPTPEVASSLFPEEANAPEVLTPEEVAPINPKKPGRAERKNSAKKKEQPQTLVEILTARGVSEETARSWATVRQKTKAVDTPRAFAGIVAELTKLAEQGIDAEYAVGICCEKSWRGLKADWILNDLARSQAAPVTSAPRFSRPAPAEPISKVEQNARAGAAAAEILRRKYEMKTT